MNEAIYESAGYWPNRFTNNLPRVIFAFPFLFLLLSGGSAGAASFLQVPGHIAAQADSLQKGLAALKENRFADALAELTAAEEQNPDDPRIHNFRGIALVQLGLGTQAATEYHEAIRLDPKTADAYRNLGFLEWTEHQLESAREVLQHATELAPGDEFAHYYLGRVLLDLQRYAPAIKELEISRVPFPADAVFLLQLSAAYLAVGRSQDANALLDRATTLELDDTQALQLASLLLAAHRKDSAVAIIEKLRRRPDGGESRWLQFDLALVYLLAGYYEKSAGEAHRYLDNQPVNAPDAAASAQAWSLIGISSAHLDQPQRSVDALRKAAELHSSDEEHWLNLTRELMELGRYPDAIIAAQEGTAAIPKSYALRLRLGAAQLSAGHYAEAESVFRELVAAGDPLPTGYVGLAQVLLRTGRAEDAISTLRVAREKLGPSFLISYFLGLAFDRAGKPAEAINAFEEAQQLNPQSAEIHISLGKTEMALGRATDAIAEFQHALRLSPGNVQATRLLAQASRRLGKTATEKVSGEPVGAVLSEEQPDLIGDFFVPQWQSGLSHP